MENSLRRPEIYIYLEVKFKQHSFTDKQSFGHVQYTLQTFYSIRACLLLYKVSVIQTKSHSYIAS